MKFIPILSVVIASLLLAACIEPPLVIGQPRDRINSEDVVVYFIDRPRCNFETVAYIQVTGGYISVGSMVANMRKEAAKIGASGLYVLHTQQLDVKEYLGIAKAIRCLSA